MLANPKPAHSNPGHTARTLLHLHIERISQKGRIRAVIGRMGPILALKIGAGIPVTAVNVRTGFPSPPKATGAVLAIRQSSAAAKGSNPRPNIMDPAIPTGAPAAHAHN